MSVAVRRFEPLQVANVCAAVLPGVLFAVGLLVLRGDMRFPWLTGDAPLPWQLGIVAVAGTLATAAGVADWQYHRRGGRRVGHAERRAEFLALFGGGLPLFVLMSLATLSPEPRHLLIPVLVVAGATLVLICYDEFTFHRRCSRLESMLHRVLTIGMGIAWLAWAQWCFVEHGGA